MPWVDACSQRDNFWLPTLRRLGIRHRRAYATRATFASLALMAGIPPGYVAEQLGHTIKMLFDSHYKWINGADRGRARQQMTEALSKPNSPLEVAQEFGLARK